MNKFEEIKENSDATSVNPDANKLKKKTKSKAKDISNGLDLTSIPPDQLTDKQRRRLEWEKLLKEQNPKTTESNDNNLKKAELKAKRREIQNAQREAKVTNKNQPTKDIVSAKQEVKTETVKIDKTNNQRTELVKKQVKSKLSRSRCYQLVKHLNRVPNELYLKQIVNYNNIHPIFVKLGIQYKKKEIIGSNARCLSLLYAIKVLVEDLEVPAHQEYCRFMGEILKNCTNYLQECRPLAVSMINALRHFRYCLVNLDKDQTDNDKRTSLIDAIEQYILNDIKRAWDAISIRVTEKIDDDDVILTYGYSSIVYKALAEAKRKDKNFSVIIVDCRPLLEGRKMQCQLMKCKIPCTYVFMNSISWAMKEANKVLLGAHALLTNGNVMSRIGTAQIALVAHAYNKPVVICCEKYKFSEKVQTDSFVYNELSDITVIRKVKISGKSSPLMRLKNNENINVFNLLYDVTPAEYVTAVITELAILPCTSVPVVLRINAKESLYM